MRGVVKNYVFGQTKITKFGSLGTANDKWHCGCLGPNGKIYAAPYNSDSILEIDPITKTTNLIGSFSGNSKWIGAVCGVDGKIYFVPHNHSDVLELNPLTGETFLHFCSNSNLKFAGGVLAPNGKIYFIPQHFNYVKEFDPVTKLLQDVGTPYPGETLWTGGILAPNGKIYGFPINSDSILEIDPITNTTSVFDTYSGSEKWVGGVIIEGIAYGAPRSKNLILKIDTTVPSSSEVGAIISSYTGGVLAPNGKIYYVPHGSNKIAIFNVNNNTTNYIGYFPEAKGHAGGVLAPNGKIYMIPRNASYVIEVSNVGDISPDMYTMPSLANLATSTYNMHQNKL